MERAAPPSKPLSKYRTAFFAFVVVVCAAYLPAIGSPRWPFLVFLGLVYTVFGIAGAIPLCTRSLAARTLYFLIEILLGTAIVAISGGGAFLVMMPLPALAAIFLSRTGLVLVSALVIAGETAAHVWHYGPGAAVDSLTTIVPAVVFVAAFGLVAGKEYRVREEAERLAGELSAANLEFKQGKVGRFSQMIPLTTEASREKKVGFEFNGVPAGTYGLECFQDVNGNGKMDFFLIVPLEPWGMYRPARPLMRAPRFSEIAFVVASDLSDIEFEVK